MPESVFSASQEPKLDDECMARAYDMVHSASKSVKHAGDCIVDSVDQIFTM